MLRFLRDRKAGRIAGGSGCLGLSFSNPKTPNTTCPECMPTWAFIKGICALVGGSHGNEG